MTNTQRLERIHEFLWLRNEKKGQKSKMQFNFVE